MLGVGAFGRVYYATLKHNPHKHFALKMISKMKVTDKSLEQVLTELKILILMSAISENSFVTNMYCAFQTSSYLVFCIEYVAAGNLSIYLTKLKKFELNVCKFIAGEVILGLLYLHYRLKITHRDLKLENVLVDEHGHCKLTDFGLSKIGKIQAYSFCGSINNLAPEVLKGADDFAAARTVDYWMLGCLVYHMLVGKPPFHHKDRRTLIEKITLGSYDLSLIEDTTARDFVSGLLTTNPNYRLGSGGVEEILYHPFFETIDLKELARKSQASPLKPYIEETVIDQSKIEDTLDSCHSPPSKSSTTFCFKPKTSTTRSETSDDEFRNN